jgi:O-antigen/teichoic acid export membrane protein
MTSEAREELGPAVRARGGDVARNAFFLVMGQVATTALAIVLSASLGRYLGAEDFGLYYLITTMALFTYVFVEWGQYYFVIRQLAVDPARSGELLGTALALRAAFTLLAAFPAWVVAWALGYDARTQWLSVFLILASLPLFLAQGYGLVFRSRDVMGRDAAVSVSNKAVALALTLPALVFGAGIPGVILAQAVAGITALWVAALLCRRLGPGRLRLSFATVKELLAGGTPFLFMTAAIAAQPYLDAVVLSKLVPANVVGWFGAARNILGTLVAPATIVAAAAYPTLSRAASSPAAFRREVRATLRPLLWLGALGATGTYLFASTAISLIYGSRGFGPASTVLEVFSPFLFLLFIDILLGNIIYASGRATPFAVAKVASVVVGTVLDIALIPVFQERFGNGGMGVVVAFGLSEFVVCAGALFILRRDTFELATALDVLRAVGAAATTLLFFRLLPPLPAWVGLPVCVLAFGAASLGLGLTGPRDLALLWRMLRRRPV